jgi:zinc transporter ZupT
MAGGFLVDFFNIKKNKNIQLLLTFSGAYLLAISLLHLIPELFSNKNITSIGLLVLTGFLIQIILEFFSQGIEHGHLHKENHITFSVLISLCLHALLEGIPLAGDLHHHHNSLLTGIVTGIFLHISTTILFESTNTHEFSVQKILAIITGALIVFLSL